MCPLAQSQPQLEPVGEGDAVGGLQQVKERLGQVAVRTEGETLMEKVRVLGKILKDEVALVLFVEEEFLYLLFHMLHHQVYRLAIFYRKLRSLSRGYSMLHKDVFCMRVKKLRKARKEQQVDLADAIGVKQSTISDIENGRRTTSFDKLAAICQHYNVSADYLLGLIEEPRPLKKEG